VEGRTEEKDKKKREKRGRGGNDKLGRKVMFWNVAGVGNKGKCVYTFLIFIYKLKLSCIS